MRVRCVVNSAGRLPNPYREAQAGVNEATVFPLIVGRSYVVYALTVGPVGVWYFVCDEQYTYYPMARPAPLFDVDDSRVSGFWHCRYSSGSREGREELLLAFGAWARDQYFYDRLTDRVDGDVSVFARHKELMDLEFPDPYIVARANAPDARRVTCSKCGDEWEASGTAAMLRCSRCSTVQHNPFYGTPEGRLTFPPIWARSASEDRL